MQVTLSNTTTVAQEGYAARSDVFDFGVDIAPVSVVERVDRISHGSGWIESSVRRARRVTVRPRALGLDHCKIVRRRGLQEPTRALPCDSGREREVADFQSTPDPRMSMASTMAVRTLVEDASLKPSNVVAATNGQLPWHNGGTSSRGSGWQAACPRYGLRPDSRGSCTRRMCPVRDCSRPELERNVR